MFWKTLCDHSINSKEREANWKKKYNIRWYLIQEESLQLGQQLPIRGQNHPSSKVLSASFQCKPVACCSRNYHDRNRHYLNRIKLKEKETKVWHYNSINFVIRIHVTPSPHVGQWQEFSFHYYYYYHHHYYFV